MSLDVGDALKEGASRTATVNGGLLVAAFVSVGLLDLVLVHSIEVGVYEWAAQRDPAAVDEIPPRPFATTIPPGLLVIGVLANLLLGEATRIVAVRTMAADLQGLIPARLVARNLPLAVLNGVVGGLLVALAVAIGLVLFVVPGVFLALSFFFVRQEIALEDENFVDAMANSWDRCRGHRTGLAVLAIVVFTVGLVLQAPYGVLVVALGQSSVVPWLIRVVVLAAVTVFGIGAATRAYLQLSDGDEAAAEDSRPDDEGDEKEWPDPPGLEI